MTLNESWRLNQARYIDLLEAILQYRNPRLVGQNCEEADEEEQQTALGKIAKWKSNDAKFNEIMKLVKSLPLISGKVMNRVRDPGLLRTQESVQEQQQYLLGFNDQLIDWAVSLENLVKK